MAQDLTYVGVLIMTFREDNVVEFKEKGQRPGQFKVVSAEAGPYGYFVKLEGFMWGFPAGMLRLLPETC